MGSKLCSANTRLFLRVHKQTWQTKGEEGKESASVELQTLQFAGSEVREGPGGCRGCCAPDEEEEEGGVGRKVKGVQLHDANTAASPAL